MALPANRFDFEEVAEHLVERAERLVAALPLLVIAIVVVWLAWRIGSWLSRRALVMEQVEAQRRSHGASDLLHGDAPREFD